MHISFRAPSSFSKYNFEYSRVSMKDTTITESSRCSAIEYLSTYNEVEGPFLFENISSEWN